MSLPAADPFTGGVGALASPPWTPTFGTAPVLDGSGNSVISASGAEGFAVWTGDTWSDDQYAELVVNWTPSGPSNDYAECIVRAAIVAGVMTQYYAFGTDGYNDAFIRKWNGSYTGLASSSSVTLAPGDTIRLSVSGAGLTATKNGSTVLTASDLDFASGSAGFGLYTGGDNLIAATSFAGDAAGGGGPPPGTHVVTGRGNFAVSTPAFLSIALSGLPASPQIGAAEPRNLYHMGMISWGATAGVFTAYPVTRDLDVVALPAGITIIYYEFFDGVTATIVELATL